MHERTNSKPIRFNTLQQQLQTALTEMGYDSREKIVDLVQEVKQEIATEREPQETQD